MNSVKVERTIAGKTLSIEVGGLARQADGAALVRLGDTMVLVTVISSKGRDDIDFFPLFVDYREKHSSVGKFPGGFFKREGRPTTEEILTMRLTDRPIRPLFPDGYRNEVQIQAMVLSSDQENQSDLLCIIGASAALSVSRVPFQGPIGAVRVSKVDGQLAAFPTYEQAKAGDLDIVTAGKHGMLLMVEGFMEELDESEVLEALEFAQGIIGEIVDMQKELTEKVNVPEKEMPDPAEGDADDLEEKVRAAVWTDLQAALAVAEKLARRDAVDAVKEKAAAEFGPAEDDDSLEAKAMKKRLKGVFKGLEKEAMRKMIAEGRRIDGRSLTDVRPIDIMLGLLPRTHGSAVFTRGETQALVTLTLGTMDDEQRIDGLLEEYRKKFLLHYNFPPFSVGEVRPIRGPGRREIGHGMLAERSLQPCLPEWEDFPYTLRLVSDILESNGSSSMATVCGATLAMMDGGVPVKRPIAGVAMGLIRENDQYRVLTDILGTEDHFGDMDFKVAGTQNGVTGLQMDIKIDGIPREVLEQALAQAKEARMHILREMLSVIDKPRETLSDYAPKLESVMIPVDKIGSIIGPGGRIIKRIQEEYGVNVEVDEVGRVSIASIDAEGVARAKEVIEGIVSEPELGKVFPGRVTSVKDFGCFVEFLPGQEGLVHISELAEGYIDRVEDVVEMGQEVQVRVVGFDDSGKIKLSIRAVADEDWKPGPPRRSGGKPSGRGPRGDRRGGGRGRDRGDRDRKPRRRD